MWSSIVFFAFNAIYCIRIPLHQNESDQNVSTCSVQSEEKERNWLSVLEMQKMLESNDELEKENEEVDVVIKSK